jgi:hypothetical protein
MVRVTRAMATATKRAKAARGMVMVTNRAMAMTRIAMGTETKRTRAKAARGIIMAMKRARAMVARVMAMVTNRAWVHHECMDGFSPPSTAIAPSTEYLNHFCAHTIIHQNN